MELDPSMLNMGEVYGTSSGATRALTPSPSRSAEHTSL